MTGPTTPPPEPEAARVSGEGIIRARWDADAAVWVSHVDYHGVKIYSQGGTEERAREALVSALVLTIATWQTKCQDALARAEAVQGSGEGIAEARGLMRDIWTLIYASARKMGFPRDAFAAAKRRKDLLAARINRALATARAEGIAEGATAERARAAGIATAEAERQMAELEADPDIPKGRHESADCGGACDFYCASANTAWRIAGKIASAAAILDERGRG